MLSPCSCWGTGGFTLHLSHGEIAFTPRAPGHRGSHIHGATQLSWLLQPVCPQESPSVPSLFSRGNSFDSGSFSASAGATHRLFPLREGNSGVLGHFPPSSLTSPSPLWLHYFDVNLVNTFKSPVTCESAAGWCKAHLYNQTDW